MVDRIKEIILAEGLTSGSFADTIGVQRSSVSHILNGRNKPSLDFIIKALEAFPHISLEWLLLGKGTMLAASSERVERPHVIEPSIFNSLPEETPVMNEQKPTEHIVNEDIRNDLRAGEVNKIVIFYDNMTFDTYYPT